MPVAGVPLADLDLPPDPLVLVCEGIEKPGNLGAMLRTADAAGVAAVVAADPVTDWGNPNVVRASKGTVFSVPVATRHDAGGAGVVARHTASDSWSRRPTTETAPHRGGLPGAVAIAVGTEKHGVTDVASTRQPTGCGSPWTARSTGSTSPTSAAIVVYEAVRQRVR